MEKIWIKKELYILNYEFMKFIPFLFLFDFFLLKSQKKGIYYLQVMMWKAGPSSELTWRAGPARGCDVVEPRLAHARQEATRTGPRGQPCGAPHGR